MMRESEKEPNQKNEIKDFYLGQENKSVRSDFGKFKKLKRQGEVLSVNFPNWGNVKNFPIMA